MKVFVDDTKRPYSDDWVVFRDSTEFAKWLEDPVNRNRVTQLSLDHDMGNDGFRDGDFIADVIVGHFLDGETFEKLDRIIVHSMNPVGAENMMGKLHGARNEDFIAPWVVIERIEYGTKVVL